MTPEDLLRRPLIIPKLTSGCPILDRFLGGGFPRNTITELVGESGCGKTQLCLQLLLTAQLPLSRGGLAASSLYIHSEFPCPLRRLQQLSRSFRSSHSQHLSPTDPGDFIFVHAVDTADHLLDVLSKMHPLLSNPPNQLPVRLVVIDSIAALFRSEFENTPFDLKRRCSLFFKISAKLKSLAKRFELVVVVTNQVVDFVSSDGLGGLRIGNVARLVSSGRRVFPALGLSWANCVNSRLFLSRNEVIGQEGGGSFDFRDGELISRNRTRRLIQVVFAPHLADSSCEFVITREGVLGVER